MNIGRINEFKSGGNSGQTQPRDDRKVLNVGDNIVRLVDEFVNTYRSWITCDDEKPHSFNLLEDGILFRAINAVMAYDLVDDPQKPGHKKKQFRLEKSHPALFSMVAHNGTVDKKGWYPSRIYLFNCIDRESTWCPINRHTKLLIKSKSEIGIGQKAFDAFANVAEEYGDPTQYDLNFTKKGSGEYSTEYGCVRANPGKHSYVKEGPLTPDEQAYQRHDLASLSEASSSEYILRFLSNKIKLIDEQLGTDFIRQLQSTVTRTENVVVSTPAIAVSQRAPTFTPAPAAAPVINPSLRTSAEMNPPIVAPSPFKIKQPAQQFVPPTPPAPVKVPEMGPCPGQGCGKMIPTDSVSCPYCGINFVV